MRRRPARELLGGPAVVDTMFGEVMSPAGKLLVIALWVTVISIPSLATHVCVELFGRRQDPLVLLGAWLALAVIYGPALGRLLAHVRAVRATPRTGRRPLHLPAALARLVDESASIRADLDPRHFESALERAWLLCRAVERLPATPDLPVDRSREALVAVQQLVELAATPGSEGRRSRDSVTISRPRWRASRRPSSRRSASAFAEREGSREQAPAGVQAPSAADLRFGARTLEARFGPARSLQGGPFETARERARGGSSRHEFKAR